MCAEKRDVLQACWNLKNYSQTGCGLAGFLHNCWCWVVRLAVMVMRGGGVAVSASIQQWRHSATLLIGLWESLCCLYLQYVVCFRLVFFYVAEQHEGENVCPIYQFVVLFVEDTPSLCVCC